MLVNLSYSKFFSSVQESAWYYDFLHSVIEEVPTGSKVLDIGTGPGKLLQLLKKEKQCDGVGTDSSLDMLLVAKENLNSMNIRLELVPEGSSLPFPDKSFSSILLCNLLFNLDESQVEFLLSESGRLLKPNGKIIILTPTGKPGIGMLFKSYSWIHNLSLPVWYLSTKQRGRLWSGERKSEEFAKKVGLGYMKKLVFHGFASVETLSN